MGGTDLQIEYAAELIEHHLARLVTAGLVQSHPNEMRLPQSVLMMRHILANRWRTYHPLDDVIKT